MLSCNQDLSGQLKRFDRRVIALFDLRPQLPKGLFLDLPDAFARDVKVLTDLFQSPWFAIIQAKAQGQDRPFAFSQRSKNLAEQPGVSIRDDPRKWCGGIWIRDDLGNRI